MAARSQSQSRHPPNTNANPTARQNTSASDHLATAPVQVPSLPSRGAKTAPAPQVQTTHPPTPSVQMTTHVQVPVVPGTRKPSARERACKECKRLKLKCDKKFPCSNCTKRGCSAICPDGELVTGRGSRFILSGSEQLYEKNCQLTERIRKLEIALGEAHLCNVVLGVLGGVVGGNGALAAAAAAGEGGGETIFMTSTTHPNPTISNPNSNPNPNMGSMNLNLNLNLNATMTMTPTTLHTAVQNLIQNLPFCGNVEAEKDGLNFSSVGFLQGLGRSYSSFGHGPGQVHGYGPTSAPHPHSHPHPPAHTSPHAQNSPIPPPQHLQTLQTLPISQQTLDDLIRRFPHPLLSEDELKVKSHIDLVNKPRPDVGASSSSSGAVPAGGSGRANGRNGRMDERERDREREVGDPVGMEVDDVERGAAAVERIQVPSQPQRYIAIQPHPGANSNPNPNASTRTGIYAQPPTRTRSQSQLQPQSYGIGIGQDQTHPPAYAPGDIPPEIELTLLSTMHPLGISNALLTSPTSHAHTPTPTRTRRTHSIETPQPSQYLLERLYTHVSTYLPPQIEVERLYAVYKRYFGWWVYDAFGCGVDVSPLPPPSFVSYTTGTAAGVGLRYYSSSSGKGGEKKIGGDMLHEYLIGVVKSFLEMGIGGYGTSQSLSHPHVQPPYHQHHHNQNREHSHTVPSSNPNTFLSAPYYGAEQMVLQPPAGYKRESGDGGYGGFERDREIGMGQGRDKEDSKEKAKERSPSISPPPATYRGPGLLTRPFQSESISYTASTSALSPISTPSSPISLALLFTILAIGSLLDLRLPPYNEGARLYYKLARACIGVAGVANVDAGKEENVQTVRVLMLMSCYLLLDDGIDENSESSASSSSRLRDRGSERSRSRSRSYASRYKTGNGEEREHGRGRTGSEGTQRHLESAWMMIGLCSKLALKLGMNKDDPSLPNDELQQRRMIWREIISIEGSMSLELGQLPTARICETYVQFPTYANLTDGGYRAWIHNFDKQYVAPIIDATRLSSPEHLSPTYDQIREMDAQVLMSYVPPLLKVDPGSGSRAMGASSSSSQRQSCFNGIGSGLGPSMGGIDSRGRLRNELDDVGVTFQRAVVASVRSMALLNIHKPWFSLAISQSSMDANMTQSLYFPSIETTYLSARSLIACLRHLCEEHYELLCRFRMFWRNAFSAAVTLCLIATRYPAEEMALVASKELDLCFEIFEGGAASSHFARRTMPVLLSLKEKARAAIDESMAHLDRAPPHYTIGRDRDHPAHHSHHHPDREEEMEEDLDQLSDRTTLVRGVEETYSRSRSDSRSVFSANPAFSEQRSPASGKARRTPTSSNPSRSISPAHSSYYSDVRRGRSRSPVGSPSSRPSALRRDRYPTAPGRYDRQHDRYYSSSRSSRPWEDPVAASPRDASGAPYSPSMEEHLCSHGQPAAGCLLHGVRHLPPPPSYSKRYSSRHRLGSRTSNSDPFYAPQYYPPSHMTPQSPYSREHPENAPGRLIFPPYVLAPTATPLTSLSRTQNSSQAEVSDESWRHLIKELGVPLELS